MPRKQKEILYQCSIITPLPDNFPTMKEAFIAWKYYRFYKTINVDERNHARYLADWYWRELMRLTKYKLYGWMLPKKDHDENELSF